jgi:hypothetical protein
MSEDAKSQIRMQYESLKYPQLADVIHQFKKDIKAHEEHIKGLNFILDVITKEIIPDRLAEDGMRGVPLADGSRIELRSNAYCSTRAGMKEALFNWLIEQELDELITEVVNPSTLKSFIKEQLESGNPVPPDEIVNYQPYVQATLVGRK